MNKKQVIEEAKKRANLGEDLEKLKKSVQEVVAELKKSINEKNIDAEVFIGGSFAKGTLIKSKEYDVDIFLRFSKKYMNENISDLTQKIVSMFNVERIHGSRDYFNFHKNKILFEIIPVIRINKPEEAQNVTDLSSLHVDYVLRNTNEKIKEEIKVTKLFMQANKCYGAESYIRGFSGYAIELLLIKFKCFLNMAKFFARKRKEKVVIDLEKHYKKRVEMNENKMASPLILVDPVDKRRNACASLSEECFKRFSIACSKFLKKPSIKFFEVKEIDKEIIEKKLKKYAKKRKAELLILSASCNKRKDIGKTKLLKFFNILCREIEKNNKIIKKEILFEEDSAYYYFVIDSVKEIIRQGPPLRLKKFVENFKKKNKNWFIKRNKIFAKVKNKNTKEILEDIKEIQKKYKIKIKNSFKKHKQ